MPKILSFGKHNPLKRNVFVGFFDRFNTLDKFSKFSIITMFLIIIATPYIVSGLLSLIQNAASVKTATISTSPSSETFFVDQEFSVDLVIDSGGDAFNAAQANVTVSNNLSIKSLTITPASLGGCNFIFVNLRKTPTVSDPSFAGAILNGSSLRCNLYTLTLQGTTQGTGTIALRSGSVKSYANHNEILLSMQDGSYSITVPITPTPTAIPTPTPTPTPVPTVTPTPTPTVIPTPTETPIPLEVPTIDPMPSETYQASLLITGSKVPSVTTVYVNSSSADVIYPTTTTWQFPATLSLETNTFIVYGQDSIGNISSSTSVEISRHRLADINGDGVIDLTDLSIFGSDWENTGTLNSPLSDMNSDGVVDLTDFSIIAKEYGT